MPGFSNPGLPKERTLLLFELITDNDAGIHIYNFLSNAEDAITLIKKAENKAR